MTNEQLIDNIWATAGLHSNELQEYRAELLRRLGAAVSAASQPRCKVCNGSDLIVTPFGDFLLNIFCNGCGNEMRYEHPCDLRTLIGAFFAAAPAQERWYTKAELHDALIARSYEPKIADELAGWIADQLELAYKKGKERAQEQPVENSPLVTIKIMRDGSMQMNLPTEDVAGLPEVLEDAATKLRLKLAEPSPQRGKP